MANEKKAVGVKISLAPPGGLPQRLHVMMFEAETGASVVNKSGMTVVFKKRYN